MNVEHVTITTPDGLALEALWEIPAEAASIVVFCHPHPQHGGTMNAPLMRAVARYLWRQGLAVLRFNFRGVGDSEGRWGGGLTEITDVEAAVAAAKERFPGSEMDLAGWSFGAATALRWQAAADSTVNYVGIAPPVQSDLTPLLPPPSDLVPAQRSFILGDRDQFVTIDELQAYADSIGAGLEVMKGSDHFFYFRDQRVGELVAKGLRGPERDSA